MNNARQKPDYFQFRWGVKEWDVGFTTIPNPVLRHYSKVPWVDKDGKHGCGISNQEALCIIHIASFHYESERGEARPAIPTIRNRMAYKKDDSISKLIKSLEHKNLLIVERKSGKCNIYSLRNFSEAIVDMDNPPIPVGGSIPVGVIPEDSPIPVGDNPPIPVGVKNKTKEEKPKEEKKKRVLDPLLLEAERETLTKRAEVGNYAVPASAGGDDHAAFHAYTLFCEMQNEMPTTKELQNMVLEFSELLKPLRPSAEEIESAFQIMATDFKYRIGNYNVFQGSFKQDLATCLRRARAKTAQHSTPRHQPESALLSQEALQERQATRPPPPQDDGPGQQIKTELALQMDQPSYQAWIASTRITTVDGDVLMISAPTDFAKDWIENRLADTIRRTATGVMGKAVEVRFETIGVGEYEIPIVTVEEAS